MCARKLWCSEGTFVSSWILLTCCHLEASLVSLLYLWAWTLRSSQERESWAPQIIVYNSMMKFDECSCVPICEEAKLPLYYLPKNEFKNWKFHIFLGSSNSKKTSIWFFVLKITVQKLVLKKLLNILDLLNKFCLIPNLIFVPK